jgi:hypothetical protein
MSAECAEIREKRRKFLKAVYDLAHGRPTAHVSKADVALRLGMDVGDREGFDEPLRLSSTSMISAAFAPFRVAPKGTENTMILGLLVKA